MKIWIDGYEANVPARLGSSQVAFELLKNLERIDQNNQYQILLPTPALNDLPKERPGWQYKILKPKKLWTRLALPIALYAAREKPDIVFSPTHYIPRFSPAKRVATVFDLAYLHFPSMFLKEDLWKLTNWTKFSVERADHIITISEFSKQDIMKQYHVDENKITVAYPGYNSNLFFPIKDQEKVQNKLNQYQIPGQYALFIGTIQPRKNLIRLIEAIKPIENLYLVIVGKTTGVGKQGWMFEEILAKPKELGIENRVIFTGFVPDEDLPCLVNGAKVFVLPSLWEGFGIPAVDSMACGIPVVVSNISSLPEIVGQAGLLVDPQSVDQITQAIRTVIADKKLWKKKSLEGIKQAKKFSWEKMAKTVLKKLEDIAEEGKEKNKKF